MTKHRHEGSVDGLRPHADGRACVRVRASRPWAESTAGQHILWMLANLLARQVNLVGRVEFEVPEVALRPGVAHFAGRATLFETLVAVVGGVFPGKVEAGRPEQTSAFEVNVGVAGSAEVASLSIAGLGWRVRAAVDAHRIEPTDDRNPVGPYFAACLAAGEVFKHLRGLLPGSGAMLSDFGLSLWDYSKGEWEKLSPGPVAPPLALPPTYIVGLGAVGQAAAAVFAAFPELSGYLTLIDKDPIDETNLNRYALSTDADIGGEKVDVVARIFARSKLSVFPAPSLWQDYATDARHRAGQRTDLQPQEASFRYEHVLSCVDKNVPRHAIQNFWPKHLLGGSTNGLGMAVAAYDATSDYECLKCHNPPEPSGPSIETLAETLRQLSLEDRAKKAREAGADINAVEQYLKTPRCGTLGESELLKFDMARVPDWSVGFVSVASGVILAAETLKAALGNPSIPNAKGNTVRYSFLTGALRLSRHARRAECDCAEKGLPYFRTLWDRES
jgi:molybdopterin/thiamine biosynthesis adenylyltransferase